MDKPHSAPGMCPFYDLPSNRCYLSEQKHSSGTVNSHCKSDSGCKRCGNYEAWASGRNYKNK